MRTDSSIRSARQLATVVAIAVSGACGTESGAQAPAEEPTDTPDASKATPSPSDGDSGPGPAPVVDAGDPSSMANWKPTSKGLWIWYFDYTGMTASQAADKAKSLGVGWVLIKSGQDATFWTDRYNAAAVNEFVTRGIRVLAWPYLTPDDVDGDIDAAAQAAAVPGTSGLVLDVEVEWEKGSHAADATKLCQGIRAKVPGVWLGYTSYGWVGLHGSFPFDAFDKDCGDAAFPQVYYSDRGVTWNGSKGLADALDQYKTAGLKAPVWPIQSNDNIAGTSAGPTTTDLNGFFDAAGAYSSLWEFPAKASTTKLTQLADLHWKNP